MISLKRFFPLKKVSTDGEWTGRTTSVGPVSVIDWSVIVAVAALLLIGLVMVYSASISLGDSPKYQTSEGYFALRHAIYMVTGLCLGWVVFRVPLVRWNRFAYILGAIGIFFLAVVFVPGIGKSVNGSVRWIGLGPINIQVSELVKFISVIFIARFAVTRQAYMHSYTKGLVPVLAYILLVAGLLAFQPDLGATVVISGTFTHHSRDEYKNLIEQHGGKNTSSVSAKTTYLLAGENMGPAKLEKATKLGIKIITEDEFLQLIGSEN